MYNERKGRGGRHAVEEKEGEGIHAMPAGEKGNPMSGGQEHGCMYGGNGRRREGDVHGE